MNIFITGASGFIGGSIAAGLVRAGHRVTGLIRNPEHAAELKRLGIEPVVGTLDDRDMLIAQAKAQPGKKPVPVYFIGVGEKLEDLETFDAREFAQALVG